MITTEPLIKPGCEYFFNTPANLAKTLFFYPTIIGDFEYQTGYHKIRSSFDSFLLMFVDSGSMEIRTGNDAMLATPGNVVLLDCYAPHEYTALSDTHVLWFHFDGGTCREYYEQLVSRRGNVLLPEHPGTMRERFSRMYSYFSDAEPVEEAALSLEILEILTALFQIPSADEGPTLDPIRLAISYINEHFTEDITLTQLSELVSLSPYYFSRAFKKETGVPPHQYVIRTRISYAKYYLSSTDKSVSEIAYSAGFLDDSAFCSTFKKHVGMTPKEYRNQKKILE